jgi:hypothetical protein
MHRRVAEALTAADADSLSGRVERLAYHWSCASGADAREQTGRWMLQAAHSAMGSLGFEQAVEYLRRARALSTVDPIAVDLELGAALRMAGDMAAARETFIGAARRAEAEGRFEDLAVAALGLGGGIAGFEVATGDQEQIELLRTAETRLPAGDTPLRAALLARRSVASGGVASVRERRLLAEEAAAIARRCGDRTVEVAALAAVCDALSGPDFVDQRADHAHRLLSLAQDRVSILLARRLALLAHLERGDLSTVDADIEHYARAAHAAGVGLYLWLPAIWRGMRSLLAGDIPAAFEQATIADAIGTRAGSANAALLVFTLRFHAHLANGTPGEYADECRRILTEARGLSLPVTYLAAPAVLLIAAGEPAPAVEILRQFRETRAEDITHDSEWLEGHWALAELAMRLDDRPAAVRLLDALRPYQPLWAVDGIGAAVFGVVAHQVGRLAGYLGRQREAATALHQARAVYERAATPRLAAQVREAFERLGVPSAPAAPMAVGTIRREGRFWRLIWRDQVTTVPDSKGMRDLAVLLSRPGRPVSALDLVETGGGPAAAAAGEDLGPVLDPAARRAYRDRLSDLECELVEAEAAADLGRTERLRAEQTMITDELAGALGLGGRPRSLGDPVDRARKAVTMRVRAAVRAIEASDTALARHLRNAVKTGRMCVYEPDTEVTWRT